MIVEINEVKMVVFTHYIHGGGINMYEYILQSVILKMGHLVCEDKFHAFK